MANHSDVAPGTIRDHKGLIYAITGCILAMGVLLMAFYDRGSDPAALGSDLARSVLDELSDEVRRTGAGSAPPRHERAT